MQELRAQGAFACWQALRDARLDLEDEVPGSFGDCLEWAKQQFTSFFHVRGFKRRRCHSLCLLGESTQISMFWFP